MTGADDRDYASPPCFLHELDPGFAGAPLPPERARWRHAERARLLADRARLRAPERARMAQAVAAHLDRLLGDVAGRTISGWWPITSELDLRFWLAGLAARGATAALPVVVAPARPLAFRRWAPGVAMTRGVWNIPVPAEGPELRPDITLAPVVGFDAANFRLGYGGGYFDRTLAALTPPPRAIGIGARAARIPSIHPWWHDVPMSAIVTEDGVANPGSE